MENTPRPTYKYWTQPLFSRLSVLSIILLVFSGTALVVAGWTEHNFYKAMEKDNLYFCRNNSDTYTLSGKFTYTLGRSESRQFVLEGQEVPP